MIVLFDIKLDKFHSTRVMNQLKVICSDLFFVDIKMSYYLFNRQELLQEAKDKYHHGDGEKEAAEYYIVNKDVFKKIQKISVETYQKKKKK